MPTGVGAAAVGVTVAGYGAVDSATAPVQTILIDRTGGVAQGARKIDPATGQYVYADTGSVEGMSGVQQLVYMRAATLLNSSAVLGLGLVAPSGVLGANAEKRLAEDINQAMKDLVDAGLIQIVRVRVVKQSGSSVRRYFTWRDLSVANGQAGAEIETQF